MRVGFPLASASLNATHASDFEPVSGFPIARNNSSIVAWDQSRGVATGEGAVDGGAADGSEVGGGAADDGTAGEGRGVTDVLAGAPEQAAITRQRETHAAASRR